MVVHQAEGHMPFEHISLADGLLDQSLQRHSLRELV
jgi:hypothetical protein